MAEATRPHDWMPAISSKLRYLVPALLWFAASASCAKEPAANVGMERRLPSLPTESQKRSLIHVAGERNPATLAGANSIRKPDATTLQGNPRICARVGQALGNGPGVPPSLYVESINGFGRESIYQGVDIDGDGDVDSVKQDCGSPSYGSCILYVRLSAGGGYEFEEGFFSVIRFHSKYYVIVGDTYPKRSTRRRLYVLTARGVDRACKSL